MMKKILALCLGLAISGISLADDDTSIWISNTYQTDFGGSKYLAFLELQPRFNKDDTKFSQLIIRPFFGCKMAPFKSSEQFAKESCQFCGHVFLLKFHNAMIK